MQQFVVVPKPWDEARAQQKIRIGNLTYNKQLSNLGNYVDVRNITETVDLWLYYNNVLRGKMGMPRAKHTPTEWKGFVNIRFSTQQREAFDNWGVSDEDVWHQLIGVIESDHKFTLTYNKQNGTINAAFTGGVNSGNNSGRTLSAFAKSWDIAVRALMFKHIEIAGGDWLSAGSVDGDEFG